MLFGGVEHSGAEALNVYRQHKLIHPLPADIVSLCPLSDVAYLTDADAGGHEVLVGVQQQKAHVIRRLKAKHGDAVNVPLLGTAPKAVGERV